jgi:hypothetical protein
VNAPGTSCALTVGALTPFHELYCTRGTFDTLRPTAARPTLARDPARGLTKTEGPKPECVLALIAATFNSRAKKNVGRHQPPEGGRLDTVSQGAYRAL